MAPDCSSMMIDCHVDPSEDFDDIYIKSIYIDYYKNVVTFGVPSANAVKIYDNENDDTTVKEQRIRVNEIEVTSPITNIPSFKNGLFYVIVTCDGTLPASASLSPCGTDSMVTVGVVLDWAKVYSKGMSVINGVIANGFDACSNVTLYDDFILIWHALMAALAAEDYKQLEKMWDMFLRVSVLNTNAKSGLGCGCK